MHTSINMLCLILLVLSPLLVSSSPLPPARPPLTNRSFTSSSVNQLIDSFTPKFINPDVGTLFSNCWPNSLDTTVSSYDLSVGSEDAFVITGDIDAEWLRDSTNQIIAYIQLLNQEQQLKSLVCGVIHRHLTYVNHDPYANSFNFNASGAGHQDDSRKPKMTPLVFEGKWELDSLMAVLKLAAAYVQATDDYSCFLASSSPWSSIYTSALNNILSTLELQQHATTNLDDADYTFQRLTTVASDTLNQGGLGNPARYTGMIKSAFRPSDDATLMPFLVPANAMAVVELRNTVNMIHAFLASHQQQQHVSNKRQRAHVKSLNQLASRASQLADEIDAGIKQYAVINSQGTQLYAYEVDGYGGANLMDDANIPSLLSLPYLGYLPISDPLYQATRAFVWSSHNPYFFNGTAASGIGGPHEGPDMVWPMSIIVWALTSDSDEEISTALNLLVESSAGTGFLHESFNKNNPDDYTRPWFAWVNGLFGQLILKLSNERPYLIFKQ